MRHFDVLRRLLGFIWGLIDDEIRAMVEVAGETFDGVLDVLDFVEGQIDVYQAVEYGSLPDYERFYECSPKEADSVGDRRGRVIAAIRAKGGLSRSRAENIATGFGYLIGSGEKYLTISEGSFVAFRADISRADIDSVYDQVGDYTANTIVVTGTGVQTDVDLQHVFNKRRCQGTNILYVNV